MTGKCALCIHLLRGEILTTRNCPDLIGYTFLPREIRRLIEDEFDVQVSRTPKSGKGKYGNILTWTEYRLNKTEYNKEGIQKMKDYVNVTLENTPAKTTEQVKLYRQLQFIMK